MPFQNPSLGPAPFFSLPAPAMPPKDPSGVRLLIKKIDNDGRLSLIPQLLTTPWDIEVVDTEDTAAFAQALQRCDAMVSMNWNWDLPAGSALRLLLLPGAGIDEIDFSRLGPELTVCNCFEHEIGIAEYVLGALLEWTLRLRDMDRALRSDRWTGSYLCGPRHGELHGKHLGILGYGRIGKEVARRARAFGMHVSACTRTPGPGDGLAHEVHGLAFWPQLLAQSDFLIITPPLNAQTRGFVDAAAFARMKSTAVLVNVARGPIVEEQALFEALRDRRIGGAIIDTWYNYPTQGVDQAVAPATLPFRELDNILMTPHGSGWTDALLPRRNGAIAANLDRLARREPFINVVGTGLRPRSRTPMDSASITQASDLLWGHWQSRTLLAELPAQCRPANRAEGYAIQQRLEARSAQALFGWKIAATSTAGQQHIGTSGPLAGRLLRERVLDEGALFPIKGNQMRVAEPEFAFRMGQDLPPREQPYSVADVLAAVESLHPAIEVPDSRFEHFVSAGEESLIADNACADRFVLGKPTTADWRSIDLSRFAVSAQVGTRYQREGTGANVLGDPRLALTWLANELRALGITLARGQVITTGTCMQPLEVEPGDHARADFGVLGSIEARFALL